MKEALEIRAGAQEGCKTRCTPDAISYDAAVSNCETVGVDLRRNPEMSASPEYTKHRNYNTVKSALVKWW